MIARPSIFCKRSTRNQGVCYTCVVKIIKKPTTKAALMRLARGQFGNLVKAVVDVDNGIIAIGGELHADEEALLLEQGSKQEHLWGINIYPELGSEDWIEFDSMINLRPAAGNMSRRVEDPKIREKIITIVTRLIQ